MAAPLRPAAFLIAGPTASGKSAVALRLAERLGGMVINADSMQLYRDLRVLTARPTPEEEARAPHRLFGIVDAAQNHSVGLWLADAGAVLHEARATGRTPIFVGGTGLYFKALTQGLSAIPAVSAAVRAKLRSETAPLAPAALHARLAACDPVMAARLRPTDPQRVLRALEVFVATGKSLSTFQGARQPALLDGATCRSIFLAPDRAALNARIEARFDAMLAAGALEEVAALAARNLDPALPAMRAHGVPHLIAALRGEMTLEAAADLGKRDTRRYAKRQFTFARHQLPDFVWRAPDAAAELAEGMR